jgi:uncharacterized protein YaiI (UPF0178 family)
MLHIFIDADACPVKNEVYRVARRCNLNVTLVANTRMRIPADERINFKVVSSGFDAADNWIAENAEEDDIVITADILLAARCIKKGAQVIGTNGKPFSEESIGETVATRDLLSELREAGIITGGAKPMQQRDRTNFLQQMDTTIQAIRRRHKSKPAVNS